MLNVATFNLFNLGTDTPRERFTRIAAIIAGDLDSPDILAVQEIKATDHVDERGVPADAVYRILIEAIVAAGGPAYDFREIPPLKDRDGGQAGSNIRVGLLFNPDRITFVDRGDAGPEDSTQIRRLDGRPSLTLSPGRIAPAHPAFDGDPHYHWAPSRKALIGEFYFAGEPVFVIVCHFKSMRSSTRREGEYTKKQRHAQALVIHQFVADLLACDPNTQFIVAGDMNDVPGSKTIRILKGDLLENLLDDLPKRLRYTTRHGGTPLALDHILVCRPLKHGSCARILHVNSDSLEAGRASDHDPVLAGINPRTSTQTDESDVFP